jgi:hypothetical protein
VAAVEEEPAEGEAGAEPELAKKGKAEGEASEDKAEKKGEKKGEKKEK